MALWKAAVIGLVGAVAIPYLTRSDPQMLDGWLHWQTLWMHPGDVSVPFSIPIFAVVTLFSWGFFIWSNR